MIPQLNYETLCQTKQPKGSFICLHGLGASGYDLIPLANNFKFSHFDQFRYIFPHAPKRPVTISANAILPAWYDIYGIDENSQQDEQGIEQAIQSITDIIDQEHGLGIPYDNIFLLGFSQGAALALATAIKKIQPLAGVIALSGYLPIADKLLNDGVATKLPIFLGHGVDDPVVPFEFAKLAHQLLKQHNYNISFHSYNTEHQIVAKEIQDINEWLACKIHK